MSLTTPGEAAEPDPSPVDDEDGPVAQSRLKRAVGRVTGACRAVGRAARNAVVTLLDAPSWSVNDGEATGETTPAQYTLVSDDAAVPGGESPTPDASADDPPTNDSLTDDPLADDADTIVSRDVIDDAIVSDEGTEPSRPVVSNADRAVDGTVDGADLDGPDVDRPELEVQYHGDAVTFVSPEQPDARITSDVWEELER